MKEVPLSFCRRSLAFSEFKSSWGGNSIMSGAELVSTAFLMSLTRSCEIAPVGNLICILGLDDTRTNLGGSLTSTG